MSSSRVGAHPPMLMLRPACLPRCCRSDRRARLDQDSAVESSRCGRFWETVRFELLTDASSRSFLGRSFRRIQRAQALALLCCLSQRAASGEGVSSRGELLS